MLQNVEYWQIRCFFLILIQQSRGKVIESAMKYSDAKNTVYYIYQMLHAKFEDHIPSGSGEVINMAFNIKTLIVTKWVTTALSLAYFTERAHLIPPNKSPDCAPCNNTMCTLVKQPCII